MSKRVLYQLPFPENSGKKRRPYLKLKASFQEKVGVLLC